jgi:two-component system KDP operon response regulator KdpE
VPSDPLVVLIGDAARAHDALASTLGNDVVIVSAPSLGEFLRTVRETDTPAQPPEGRMVVVDHFVVDLACRQVTWRGQPVHVTRREFGLLVALSREPRGVLTFDDLLVAGWGDVDHRDVGLVHSAIMRLRAKLKETGVPVQIMSIWGVGFRLAESLDPATPRTR